MESSTSPSGYSISVRSRIGLSPTSSIPLAIGRW
jgi:hypothetical protein